MISSPTNQLIVGPGPFPLSILDQFQSGDSSSPLYSNDQAGRNQAIADGRVLGLYDLTRSVKLWADESIPETQTSLVKYTYYDAGGNLQSFSIGASEARSLNIYALPSWPPYIPAPTPATSLGLPTPASLFSTLDQAIALFNIWKALGFSITVKQVAWTLNDQLNGEARGLWALVINNVSVYYVGQQLALSMSNGVGSPGHWSNVSGVPIWISDIPPLPSTMNTILPTPQRLLNSNERFQAQVIGGPLLVFETPLTVSSGIGVDTSSLTPLLNSIAAEVDQNNKFLTRIIKQFSTP